MASSSRAPSSTHTRKESPESYASLARRNAAAETVQSYERLSWHAAARNESLVQTRLHFQNIIAGFSPPSTTPETSQAQWSAVSKIWKTDASPHVPDPPDWDPVRERCKTAVTGGVASGKGKDKKSPGKERDKGKGREDEVVEARKGKKRKSGVGGEGG